MTIQEIVADILKKKEAVGGVDSVYLVACGGSFAGFYPAKYLLDHASRTLRCAMFTANEFVHALPDACGPNSIVLGCSMRGTPETGEAVRAARERGAATVAFYVQESKMTGYSEYKVQYETIAEDVSRAEQTNAALELQFCFELLHQKEGCPLYEPAMAGFAILDDIYRSAAEYCRPRAKAFAAGCKDEPVIYVMGGGPSMGAAYIFSICNLMEMQWVHSPTVNSGEYLHGPFETLDKNLPMFVLVSEGRTRPVDERALRFLKNYGEKLYVPDAKELGINRLDSSVAEYFNHLVFSSVLNNVYLRELSYAKKHPYQNRRYMWQVEY